VLLAGRLLDGRYQIGPTMGWGGLTDVYYGRDRITGDAVAVKVLPGVDPAAISQAVGDAEALAMLHDPAIARLRARGVFHDTPYLVLDLVEGPSLAELVQRGPLGEEDVVAIGAVLSRALAHAHAIGVVHREVRPTNVVVTALGEPRLVDFGISMLADPAAVTGGRSPVGLHPYLAPEQVRGEPAGPASDVYSLGLVLLEARTGGRAFSGAPADAAVARLERPPALPDGMAPWLHDVLHAMTAVDEAARPNAATIALAMRTRRSLHDVPTQPSPEVAAIDLSDRSGPTVALSPPVVAVQPAETERWAWVAVAIVGVIALVLLAALLVVAL
jgi:serine/threonine protein kinase